MIKIKKCFWCRYDEITLIDNKHLLDSWVEYRLHCPSCGLTTGPDMKKKRLVKKWNEISESIA